MQDIKSRCGVATLALVGPSGSDKAQGFRAGVNTVPVYATVTDARGVLIPNLGMSDFQIDDDGRRQAITFFKRDIQPMTMAVLLDSSPSLFDVALRLQKAVTELVGHLRPDDRACLGTFSHVVTLNPALTGDHDVLLRRLGDTAPYPAGTALWDAIEAGRADTDATARKCDGASSASRSARLPPREIPIANTRPGLTPVSVTRGRSVDFLHVFAP